MARAAIRTSDRLAYKRCRRKWSLSSGLRYNRTPSQGPSYFWIGTGGHFAMEDYHGYNNYGHPAEAFKAYVEAWRQYAQKTRFQLPDDWQEQAELGVALMDYYMLWLQERSPLQTLWIDGVPQVEVKVEIQLPHEYFSPKVQDFYNDGIFYQATLDRVVIIDGEYWLLDYKFFKQLQQLHLEFDPQMSAYVWCGHVMYPDMPLQGAIFEQHRKDLPNPPRVLKNGSLSAAKNQKTTHRLYRKALIDTYGDVASSPSANIDLLNHLAEIESKDRDDFIRRDYTVRTPQQIAAIGQKILMEAEEMLDHDIPLYPNETKDCSWDCSFQDICIMMDSGDDWEFTLNDTTISRTDETDDWRLYLP